MSLWPLLRSWFIDALRVWDRPLRDLHSAWWLAVGRAIAESTHDVFLAAQIPL